MRLQEKRAASRLPVVGRCPLWHAPGRSREMSQFSNALLIGRSRIHIDCVLESVHFGNSFRTGICVSQSGSRSRDSASNWRPCIPTVQGQSPQARRQTRPAAATLRPKIQCLVRPDQSTHTCRSGPLTVSGHLRPVSPDWACRYHPDTERITRRTMPPLKRSRPDAPEVIDLTDDSHQPPSSKRHASGTHASSSQSYGPNRSYPPSNRSYRPPASHPSSSQASRGSQVSSSQSTQRGGYQANPSSSAHRRFQGDEEHLDLTQDDGPPMELYGNLGECLLLQGPLGGAHVVQTPR